MNLEKLKSEVKNIEKERQIVKSILRWQIPKNLKNINNFFKTILMIVESPNKARTISNFFGKPSRRIIWNLNIYEINIWNKLLLITSSWWHVLDLITKEGIYWVQIENNKNYPIYDSIKFCKYKFKLDTQIQITDNFEKCEEITLDKIEIIKTIQKISLEVDEIYLATDPDTEWEKISYDLFCLIKPFNPKIFRIEYHEVTKKAILNAIENKRQIDFNLVKAQIVRRIADRWVWFSLSEKLQQYFNDPNYSAGRVQTPVLWRVIERDKEGKEKKAIIKITLPNIDNDNEKKHLGFYYKKQIILEENAPKKVKNIKKTKKISVKILNEKKEISNPLPPFTTDTLLEEANTILKLWSDETMQIAQDLFENWLITYHRTDSIHISNVGINIAKQYLTENWLEKYFHPRKWGEEWTHEAIRPTKPLNYQQIKELVDSWIILWNFTYKHYKVYDLIFKRFIASQMSHFEYKSTEFELDFPEINYTTKILLPTQIIKNWRNLIIPFGIYHLHSWEYEVDIDKKLIPKIPPYTQGTLIMEMKNKWLWRPSTYATIINTLIKRGYIIQLPKTNWLKHTKKWENVYEFLISNYKELIDEKFTVLLEKQMDEVEKGKDHNEILNKLLEKLKSYKLII